MTRDIHTLKLWIYIVAAIAAVCTTSFPVLYSFFPWRQRLIGIVIMMQGISFALLMDVTMLSVFWHPKDILVLFWMDAIVLTLIAASTASMSVLMVKMNRRPYKRKANR